MAEENKGVQVPGEAESSRAAPQEQAAFDEARDQAIKDKARKLGWRPKGEYEGDPADWRSAREFLERQSFFDKIKSVKDDLYESRRENKKLHRDLEVIKEYVKKMSEVEYTRAVSDLQAQKAVAVEQANVEEVRRIDAQIDKIKDAKVEIKTEQANVPAGPPPEFDEWKSVNKWYDDDSEMRASADELGYGVMARNPGMPVKEVLRQVEAKIRKMYSEKFTGTRKPSASAVEAGGASASSASTSRKGKLSVSDLDETQRKAMDTFVKRGVLTEQQYLDSLAKSMGMR